MFAIQIHSVEPSPDEADEPAVINFNNVFLDISSEGQRPRRYFLGSFNRNLKRTYESIVHYTNGAVTLNLNFGPFRYHQLGVSTLYRFLQEPPSGEVECVTFGQRGSSAVFKLCYSVRPVQCWYEFALNEITCLKQCSTSWRQDQLFAEIEYNHSPHSVERGARNKYKIGRFSAHDIAPIHTVHNMTFSTLSNFVITFYVKSMMSEHILGAIKFTPLAEVLSNLQNQMAGEPAAPFKKVDGKLDGVAQYFDHSMLTKSDESAGGLLAIRVDAEETVTEFLLSNEQTLSTQKIAIVGSGGGAYEVVYTLKKVVGSLSEHISGPRTLAPVARLPGSLDSTASEDYSSPNFIAMAETVTDGYSFKDKAKELTAQLLEGNCEVSGRDFAQMTFENHVEVLIDGRDTFRRYYEVLMGAQHSISLLAWETNLSFGLVLAPEAPTPLPVLYDPSVSKWITFEDVILSKAKEGVVVRVVVWRHELLSYVTRFLYLGEVTIEAEVAKLEKRCKKLGLVIRVIHTSRANAASYANPTDSGDANIIIVIAGNPKGIISTHHEKLLLIDPECPKHTVAFTGGFDIARGRFDQSAHLVPLPYRALDLNNIKGVFKGVSEEKRMQAIELAPGLAREQRYSGRTIQALLPPIRFLWHDIQLLIYGPATRLLQLHFAQRWTYAFSQNPNLTKNFTVHMPPMPTTDAQTCKKHRPLRLKGAHSHCAIRLERTWKNVFDTNFLFDDYRRMIRSARKFLYFEHQYPFQNFALTHLMCEMLKSNPELRVIIVTPVKTDLPTGLVGEIFDWSQDHIIEHLQLIYSTAPDRVGVYGLVNQDPKYPERLKPIYVHTKLTIIDDLWMVTGSTNMDNVSFFYSSELSIEVHNAAATRDTRIRLFKEHLGSFYQPALDDDLTKCFDQFKLVSGLNHKSLQKNGLIIGRPVAMTPQENYKFILSKVFYPTKISKFMMKMGLETDDVTQLAVDAVDNVVSYVKSKL